MKYRNLRIAWSVVCGIAAVLLTAWCIQTYHNGHLQGYFSAPLDECCCRSFNGFIVVLRMASPNSPPQPTYITTTTFHVDSEPIDIGVSHTWSGFVFDFRSTSFWWIQVPYWFLVGVPSCCAAAPWIRVCNRFSLRTLLVATDVHRHHAGTDRVDIEDGLI